MKKILVFTLLLFSASLMQAQNDFVTETDWGIRLGGNVSRVSFDPVQEQTYNIGFHGGLVFRHISQKNLGIQIELNYMQGGWNETLANPNDYSRHLNYIQLPFLSHFNIGRGKTRVFFNIGPYVSYLLSESEKMDLISEEEVKEYYGTDIDNHLEYGVSGAFGLSRRSSVGIFQIEGRVSQSMINIFRSDSEPFSGSLNQIGEISLIYYLNFDQPKNEE
ncbi:outer membrane beta-barrel protein [Maribellus comscasis]|uniref:Outer membrane beta-barrel protein n=1 Tax=Maribellus comscasis TaxID=2681766 RepID=A0A6I6K1P3_9BACT|nr:porin family protein [Maribellus comscasis]QGY46352.1 outer membrane beta-barrel protein [Maribellus comscasis]